jgi:hypothetical protein
MRQRDVMRGVDVMRGEGWVIMLAVNASSMCVWGQRAAVVADCDCGQHASLSSPLSQWSLIVIVDNTLLYPLPYPSGRCL